MNRKITIIGAVLALTLALGACQKSSTGDSVEPTVALRLTLQGLADIGPDFVYEGWLIVNGVPVAAGRFSVDGAGVPSTSTFTVKQTDADGATAYVLTIEPAVGDDPAPSAVHILAGAIAGGAGRLTIDHPSALGTDLSTAGGSFILAAPTTPATGGGSVDDDFFRGIWFLDPTAGPGATLDLPALPAAWTYEGWVVVGGVPYSTGRFDAADAPDSDGGGASAGTDPAPPFPGQDFISGPTLDLRGGVAVISIEPVPDTGPEPFLLKPLVDGTIDDVGAGGSQILANQAATNNPTGTVSLDGAAVPAAMTSVVELDLSGLEDLGPDFAYEGWLVGPSGPMSTGVFSIDANGTASFSAFSVDAVIAAQATDFVLTIEPVPDFDPMPAATKVLGGAITGGAATLGLGHPAALGTDLSTAGGSYILAAPTSPAVGTVDDDFFMGIWFLDPTGAPDPTLTLPALNPGWQYEGWVVVGGMPFSTGRFDVTTGADTDGGGASAGPDPAPPFPGQDFVTGPMLDLVGGTVVISIEPEPDNSPEPFALKPLIDAVVEDFGAGGAQPLVNQAATNNPTGTAMIR